MRYVFPLRSRIGYRIYRILPWYLDDHGRTLGAGYDDMISRHRLEGLRRHAYRDLLGGITESEKK